MNRRSALRLVSLSGAGLFLPRRWGRAQQQDPQPEFTIRSESRLVLLDVSVIDRTGRLVAGLSKDNFTIFEDGRKQTLSNFEGHDVPVTVGILVDESFSMRPKRPDVLTAALTFIGACNPQDEIFVLNFNDVVRVGLPQEIPFSDDIKQLSAALERGTPEGRTALYDAVIEGLAKLESGRRGKKALLVISDGGDNISQHTRADLLEAVLSSSATVYTVGLFENGDPDRDPVILRKLANISGGGAFFPHNPPETVPVCRAIAKELRNRYTIGYVPKDAPGKGTGALRRIQVQVAADGHDKLFARTRSEYRYVDNGGDRAIR